MRTLALMVGTVCLASTSSFACSTPSYSDARISIRADNLAEQMMSVATTVQLVEVSSITPWDVKAYFAQERAAAVAEAKPEWISDVNADYDAYEREYATYGASSVTLSSIETLKGRGSETLTFGAFVPADDESDLSSLNRIPAHGPLPSAEGLYNAYPLTDLRLFGGSGSCATPFVVRPGERYVVFLNATGALMRKAVPASSPVRSDLSGIDGPNFERVEGEDDIWLQAVRTASAD